MLGSDTRPAFFPVANASRLGLFPPESRGGIPVRSWVRSLAGMQKEALVLNGGTGLTWRLVSDEGSYLAGHDRAPCPLCHFISGMVSSYMAHAESLARGRGIATGDLELSLENFYTMQGSALQGTMTGGALDPRLAVRTATRIRDPDIQGLVADAVVHSPINGLLADRLDSQFTLHHNGRAIPVGRVRALQVPAEPDPRDRFDAVEMSDSPPADDLIVKLASADEVEDRPGGVNSSFQETQSRNLRVLADCKLRDDGVKEIVEDLISPVGSEYRFLSDEAPPFGGSGLAPDSFTFLSAGIGFCFMTQFGRYAAITKTRLDEYRIVQDTHYHPGQEGRPGRMDPVETHVYLVTSEGDDFAQRVVDMGEQTCFLHATCRSRLGLVVEWESLGAAPKPARTAD